VVHRGIKKLLKSKNCWKGKDLAHALNFHNSIFLASPEMRLNILYVKERKRVFDLAGAASWN
jgi:hypothetical protein